MEDSTTSSLKSRKPVSKKKLLVIIGAIVLVIAAVLVSIFVLQKLHTIRTVQDSLANAASVMEKANGDNGYPQELPAELADNKAVTMTGGASFDGTAYCITSTSTNDTSVVYHRTSTSEAPQSGTCPKVAETAKPGTPTNIEVTIVSAGQIGLTWASASNAVSYTLECAEDKKFVKVVSNSMKASQARICDDLEGGSSYFVRVRANNASGAGPWSSVKSVATSQLSTPPEDLTVKATSSTSIRYSWSPVKNARSYVLEWASDVNYQKNVKSVTLTGTSGTALELKPNTQYFFHVKAVTDSFDASRAAFSEQVYTTTPKA